MIDLNLTVSDYPYGAPCWVDLLVSDVDRARDFYSELFGWRWLTGDAATGGYTMALLDGHPVAGISRKPPGAPVPSQWTTYLRVGDINVAAHAIASYGGRPLGHPVDLGNLARTLVAVDPGGAYFGVWEPHDLPGSGLLDRPGSITWNELLTRDYDVVLDFYENIFAHGFIDETENGGPRWSTAHTIDGNPAYGVAEIEPDWPRQIPAHWIAHFATDNVVSTLAHALELGAKLVQGPFDGPYGLGAVLSGLEGEVFSVLVPDLD